MKLGDTVCELWLCLKLNFLQKTDRKRQFNKKVLCLSLNLCKTECTTKYLLKTDRFCQKMHYGCAVSCETCVKELAQLLICLKLTCFVKNVREASILPEMTLFELKLV